MRDFTCVADKLDTIVLFFSKEILFPVLKVHDLSLIETMFRERSGVISSSIAKIE